MHHRLPAADPVPVQVVNLARWYRRRRVTWLFVATALAFAVGWVASHAASAAVPLLIAAIIAYVLAPAVQWLQRWMPRALAVAALAVVFAGVGVGLGAYLGSAAVSRLGGLPEDLAHTWTRASAWTAEHLGVEIDGDLQGVIGLGGPLDPADLRNMVQRLFGRGQDILGGVVGALAVPFLALFLLYDYERIVSWLRRQVPPRHRPAVFGVLADFDHRLGGFIRGQFLVAAILTVLYSLGFWLVGAPYPLLLGVLSGLGNIVPYVGTAMGIVVATALVLAEGASFTTLLLTYAVFAAVQTLEGWAITPRIVGRKVGLPALAVLVAVLVFGELMGFIGIMLAVPVAAALRIVAELILARYRRSDAFMDKREGAERGRAMKCHGDAPPTCTGPASGAPDATACASHLRGAGGMIPQ